jgi:hypothetical protein
LAKDIPASLTAEPTEQNSQDHQHRSHIVVEAGIQSCASIRPLIINLSSKEEKDEAPSPAEENTTVLMNQLAPIVPTTVVQSNKMDDCGIIHHNPHYYYIIS